jgi:hypothetical protein
VTEADPFAALAAQLDGLRGQLGQLRTRFSDDYGQVMMLRLEVKQLGERIKEASAKRQAEKPQAPYWLGLTAEEYATRLAELRAWVDEVARAQYPGYLAVLPPCWPDHPEAVIELSNVMTEWTRIYGDPENRPLQDVLWFHERWLPGALERFRRANRCDAARCLLKPLQAPPWERSPPPARHT